MSVFFALTACDKKQPASAHIPPAEVGVYSIHKSRLDGNPKFIVIYQPIYSSWVNRIEPLWLALHETVTRNHLCRHMWRLLRKVGQFMEAASPFSGNKHGLKKWGAIRLSYLVYVGD